MKFLNNLAKENKELKARLAEAEELLAAIKSGEVDAFVTDDQQVFTLKSADYAYRVLVETINEGALTLTSDGIVMYCNNRLAVMTGLPIEKIIGSSILNFVIPEDLQRLKFSLLQCEKSTARAEFQLKKTNGTPFPVLVSCTSLKLTDASLCMIITDLTEQKNYERDLVTAHIELDRANRLYDIGVLSTTVAHELRNPLAAIQIAAANIKRKANNPELEKHLINIEKKIAESDQIINNLLFYSRLKQPHYESIKIIDIIKESTEAVEQKKKKQIMVIKNLDSLDGINIEADPFQIKEVFNNIFNNALDAVAYEKGEIKITAENEDEFIKLVIQDNGPGIDKGILDKIFDPFFTTKSKGTGLGLAVCKQIINMHHGEIGVKSELGQGTSIIVRLPKKERKKERKNKWPLNV